MYSIIVVESLLLAILIWACYWFYGQSEYYKKEYQRVIWVWEKFIDDKKLMRCIIDEMRHIIRKFKGRE